MNPNNRSFITPTVARMVWLVPVAGDALFKIGRGDQPLAGQIAHVNDDGTVNLSVIAADGTQHARKDVPLVQEGDERPDRTFCMWMPFQTAQVREQRPTAEQFRNASDTLNVNAGGAERAIGDLRRTGDVQGASVNGVGTTGALDQSHVAPGGAGDAPPETKAP